MSIYSTNRSGSMLIGNDSFNERYSGIDAGTIMCDTEANTMAIFEAILYSDFHELEGRKSGVLTEADAKKFNMESIKGLGSKIVDSMKSCYEKIKSLIKSALEKILSFNSEGKKLLASAKKAVSENGGWSGRVEYSQYNYHHNAVWYEMPESFKTDFKAHIDNRDIDKKGVLSKYLTINGNAVSPSNYVKEALAAAKLDKPAYITVHNIVPSAMNFTNSKDLQQKASEYLKGLKKEFNHMAGIARAACDNKAADVMAINAINSAFQTVATTKSRAFVACMKANNGALRLALSKALGEMHKKPKNEFAMMEAYADMSLAFDTDIYVTDEARTLAESVVNV